MPPCCAAAERSDGSARSGAGSIPSMPEEATGKTGQPTPKRNKPERPRDELGRPLDWDAANKMHLEPHDALSIEETDRLAGGHGRAGRGFPAHEAWETAWKKARDTE